MESCHAQLRGFTFFKHATERISTQNRTSTIKGISKFHSCCHINTKDIDSHILMWSISTCTNAGIASAYLEQHHTLRRAVRSILLYRSTAGFGSTCIRQPSESGTCWYRPARTRTVLLPAEGGSGYLLTSSNVCAVDAGKMGAESHNSVIKPVGSYQRRAPSTCLHLRAAGASCYDFMCTSPEFQHFMTPCEGVEHCSYPV